MSRIKDKIINKGISYPGIKDPRTIQEIKVEIYGLKNAIKIAEELISRYEQVLVMIDLEREASHASQEESISEVKSSKRED